MYQGKGTPSPVRLALGLLTTVPAEVSCCFGVWVLADGGFESAAFIQGVRGLGFEFVVGVRSTRCTDHPGQVTVQYGEHGSGVNLSNWSWETLTLAHIDRRERTFFSVASHLRLSDMVAREGARRWAIEAFIKTVKGRCGLERFAQHSKQGVLHSWCLSSLAFLLCCLQNLDLPVGSAGS